MKWIVKNVKVEFIALLKMEAHNIWIEVVKFTQIVDIENGIVSNQGQIHEKYLTIVKIIRQTHLALAASCVNTICSIDYTDSLLCTVSTLPHLLTVKDVVHNVCILYTIVQ